MNAQLHRLAATIEPAKDLETLAVDWLRAKKDEADANKRRIAVELEMLALIELKPEGATTTEAGMFKVTAETKLTRSIDWEKYDGIREQIPERLRPVKFKRELDATGCKYLENNEPQIYALIAPCITTKPAKTAITVKGA
jgi:hypothetical protein